MLNFYYFIYIFSASLPVPTQSLQHQLKQHGYQLKTNQDNLLSDEETPPALPPRNYNNPTVHTDTQVQKSNNKLSPGYSSTKQQMLESLAKTPKEEDYADKLRQQAKKFSQPSSTILNAAGYQHKRLPETKASVSQSKPVERTVIERQECHTPPPPTQLSLTVVPQNRSNNGFHSGERSSIIDLENSLDSNFSGKQKRFSTGSASEFQPGSNLNSKTYKRLSVGEPVSPVLSNTPDTSDHILEQSKGMETRKDRPATQRPTSIVEIIEMPRKQIVIPLKSENSRK